MSGFLRTEQAGELLRSVFEDPNATDDEIAYVRGVLSYIGYYEHGFLARLTRLLDHEEGGIATARYLAWSGDEAARAEVAKWLDSHELKTLRSSELPVAFRLMKFADSAEAAKAFLNRVLARGLGHGDEGEIYAALAEAGDNEAPAKLEAIAYQDARRGSASLVSAIRALAKSSGPEAFAATERFYHRTRSDAAAYLALELDPQLGMKLLLDVYPESRVPVQWDAARTLRWLAPKRELVAELTVHADSLRASMRKMAAEIAGWLPFEQSVPFLEKLADDEDETVERAALAALRRRQADKDCASMIDDLPAQPRARQWAWLNAIVRCGDPDCLANAADPRALHSVLNELGDEFRAEANRVLQTRMRAVDKQAEDAERNRLD
ncbi:MAG TPA: hypothetical protein VM915_05340 [Verrucomicrobiae bacterium]|nr:hypothetical protein [Verrucomicrobiae bacterium]